MSTQNPDARALYVISVAAELAGMHQQTLRMYERKGLIEPARTSGRSRRYSDEDIRLLRRIQELSNEGVSLAGVNRILALEEQLHSARSAYRRARSAPRFVDGRNGIAGAGGSPGIPPRDRAVAQRGDRAFRAEKVS